MSAADLDDNERRLGERIPSAWSVESAVTRLEQAEKGLALYKKVG